MATKIKTTRSELCPVEWLPELHKAMEKAIVVRRDMADELCTESVDIVVSALDKHGNAHDGASKQIKETMDKKFGPSWHAIVGEGFAFDVTHQLGHMAYIYYLGTRAVLLFK
jgi:dynein light chain 4